MTIFGVWMWSRSVRLRGAETVFSQCAKAGVTDVYFLVKGLLGTAAYRSDLVPADGERDLLAEALTEAHRHNIRLHAWFTTACDKHYVTLHPESGRYHCRKGPDNQMVSLTDEGYQTYMENAVREICRNYPVDGIHLDYIRYNHITSGWSETDLKLYAEEGAEPAVLRNMLDRMYYSEDDRDENLLFNAYRDGNIHAAAFARARRKQVVRFARRLRQAALAENNSMIITAALMPEGAYDDTAFADLHYGQNYYDAADLYDYVLPMAYTKTYQKDGAWLQKLAQNCSRGGLKTVMGLQAFSQTTGEDLQNDITAMKSTDADGICLFREGSFVMATVNHSNLTVYNASESRITGIRVSGGGETANLSVQLEAGEEGQWILPFAVDTVRTFCGETEICVFTVKK